MYAIDSQPARAESPRRADPAWGTPVETTTAILEVVATEHPELINFQSSALLHSTLSFTIRELAVAFGVSPEDVGQTVRRACRDLDQLERYRRVWRDPRQVIESVNVTALLYVCRARLRRISGPRRRQKLERILRRVVATYELARARAWIDDFIGPLPTNARKAEA